MTALYRGRMEFFANARHTAVCSRMRHKNDLFVQESSPDRLKSEPVTMLISLTIIDSESLKKQSSYVSLQSCGVETPGWGALACLSGGE